MRVRLALLLSVAACAVVPPLSPLPPLSGTGGVERVWIQTLGLE